MIRLCLISTGVVALILGIERVVSLPSAFDLDDSGRWACAGINLGACWLAFVPMVVVARRWPDYVPQAAMGAIVIRMMIVVPATFAVFRLGFWPTMPLTLWILMFYLALLAVETMLAVQLMNREDKEMQGTSAS